MVTISFRDKQFIILRYILVMKCLNVDCSLLIILLNLTHFIQTYCSSIYKMLTVHTIPFFCSLVLSVVLFKQWPLATAAHIRVTGLLVKSFCSLYIPVALSSNKNVLTTSAGIQTSTETYITTLTAIWQESESVNSKFLNGRYYSILAILWYIVCFNSITCKFSSIGRFKLYIHTTRNKLFELKSFWQ